MAHNGKHTSVGEILWRVLNKPICSELTIEQASEYALEFLRIIGAPLSYIDKTEELQLCDYKVSLPADLIDIRGVRCNGRAMRYATDLYHVSIGEDDKNCNNYCREYTYIVQNCILTASQKDECIEISYKAIPLDETGYPLIPDNESYRMGIEYYIIFRFLEPLWTMGKITDKVFQYYEQKSLWYKGQAGSSIMVANMDQLESTMNGLNRLLINNHAYEVFYKNYGEKERIKRYF